MTFKPSIGTYLDEEEKELIESIENSNISQWKSELSPERKKQLQEIARNTINEERTRISLRIPQTNLLRIKSEALQKGIPYQTYLNSIIHEHIHGKAISRNLKK